MKTIVTLYLIFNLLSFWTFAAILMYSLDYHGRLIFGVCLFGFILTEAKFSYNLNRVGKQLKKFRKVIEKERDYHL